MSVRLTCRACKTTFLAADSQLGRRVACPKCGVEQAAPSTAIVETPPSGGGESVFVPSDGPSRRRIHPAVLTLAVLIPVLAVAAVVAWPRLRAWWYPVPPDPIEVVAITYLRALAEDDPEAAAKVSVVVEPPAIRSFRTAKHARKLDRRLKGSFRPIAELHARIDEKFVYDPEIGRFQLKNALGAAAETLDALHEAKAKAEQEDTIKKMASPDPEEALDSIEKSLTVFAKLSEGVLAPKKLLPTYAQLVDESKPPLPPGERELALDYGNTRETWDRLLKRPFPTLKADGPYVLDKAEVLARVTDKLASSGDPPSRLRLKLMRFRLEGIDTGWRVVSARREGEAEPAPLAPVEPAPRSSSAAAADPANGTTEPGSAGNRSPR